MGKWLATARCSPFVCPLCEGVGARGQAEPSPGKKGVGKGHVQLLPAADDVGAGLVGALLSLTQLARESICRQLGGEMRKG